MFAYMIAAHLFCLSLSALSTTTALLMSSSELSRLALVPIYNFNSMLSNAEIGASSKLCIRNCERLLFKNLVSYRLKKSTHTEVPGLTMSMSLEKNQQSTMMSKSRKQRECKGVLYKSHISSYRSNGCDIMIAVERVHLQLYRVRDKSSNAPDDASSPVQ